MRVPAGGGTPEVVTVPDTAAGEIGHAWPDLLPGGRAIVFSVLTNDGWKIAARSLGDERHEIIIEDAGLARFMPRVARIEPQGSSCALAALYL